MQIIKLINYGGMRATSENYYKQSIYQVDSYPSRLEMVEIWFTVEYNFPHTYLQKIFHPSGEGVIENVCLSVGPSQQK